ncbi:hypothetical protein [Mycobacterium sp.]|uniref:hypothetical protein n=1 Tax=Mycobacterium sp. TaxID=1785 RepID=UPI003F9CD040
MVRTGDRADITYDRAKDSIAIDWPEGHTEHMRAKARLVFDKVTHANGVDYRDGLFEGNAFAPNTVHPSAGSSGARRPTATAGSRRRTNFMSTTPHCSRATSAATPSCPSPCSPSATSRGSCRAADDAAAVNR